VVVSSTLDPARHPEVVIVKDGIPEAVRALKAEAGKDIWLFGGSLLFRSLLDLALVDAIEVSVFPVLLGSGTPLLGEGHRASLKLESCKPLPSGVLMLSYSICTPQLRQLPTE
jgi:dihydrofolate reductase